MQVSNPALAELTITVLTFQPLAFRIMSLALLRSGSLSCSWRANSAYVRVLSSLAQKTVTDIDVFFILLFVRVGSYLLQPSKLEIIKTTKPKLMPAHSDMKFGHKFVSYGRKSPSKVIDCMQTDHMLTIPWSLESGWGRPKIRPCMPTSIDSQ